MLKVLSGDVDARCRRWVETNLFSSCPSFRVFVFVVGDSLAVLLSGGGTSRLVLTVVETCSTRQSDRCLNRQLPSEQVHKHERFRRFHVTFRTCRTSTPPLPLPPPPPTQVPGPPSSSDSDGSPVMRNLLADSKKTAGKEWAVGSVPSGVSRWAGVGVVDNLQVNGGAL